MKLYELKQEMFMIETEMMAWAEEHDGCIDEFPLKERLDSLEGDIEEKAIKIGCFIKDLQKDSTAFKNEIKSMSERKLRIDNKIKSMEKYLSVYLPTDFNLNDPKCAIKFNKSKKLFFEENEANIMEKLDKKYINVKETKSPMKKDIKKAIENGEKFFGIELKRNYTLKIK